MKTIEINPQTNVGLVAEFMEYSNHGTLSQCFAIEALTKWSQTVLNNQASLREKMQGGMIDADAWIACAQNWMDKQAAFYRTHKKFSNDQLVLLADYLATYGRRGVTENGLHLWHERLSDDVSELWAQPEDSDQARIIAVTTNAGGDWDYKNPTFHSPSDPQPKPIDAQLAELITDLENDHAADEAERYYHHQVRQWAGM